MGLLREVSEKFIILFDGQKRERIPKRGIKISNDCPDWTSRSHARLNGATGLNRDQNPHPHGGFQPHLESINARVL